MKIAAAKGWSRRVVIPADESKRIKASLTVPPCKGMGANIEWGNEGMPHGRRVVIPDDQDFRTNREKVQYCILLCCQERRTICNRFSFLAVRNDGPPITSFVIYRPLRGKNNNRIIAIPMVVIKVAQSNYEL